MVSTFASGVAPEPGDHAIHILTNLPEAAADAVKVAELYRKRWTLETAFQELESSLHGEIVTLDPTGVLSVRTGTHLDLGAALRSWGFSLAGIQRAYVNGRRWSSSIATIPLTRDAEIVVESGPVVPPHHAYDFPPGL